MAVINDGGPAFPQPITYAPDGRREWPCEFGWGGMSLRQHYAGQIMAAMSADDYDPDEQLAKMMADAAVKRADALIAALGA